MTTKRQMKWAGFALLAAMILPTMACAQTWSTLSPAPTFAAADTLLLTDGTILVHQNNSSNWWKLTPDAFANYHDGTLAPVASTAFMNYAPGYYASAVLPDGRVIVEGGEYNYGKNDHTNLGAIYDPIADTWTQVSPPDRWKNIGDASSVVLSDGTFMLANICIHPCPGVKVKPPEAALLDEQTLTWTVLTHTNGYVGKSDENTEEGWTLLPTGEVLTVNTYIGVSSDPNGTNSERYDPSLGQWRRGGSTVAQLWDSGEGCGGNPTHEVGPAVLRFDGTVFALGANSCPDSAGHTAIFNAATGIWQAGPNFPADNDAADAPAALLITGNVLVDVSQGVANPPCTFYESDGISFFTIPQPKGVSSRSSEPGRMLETPSGEILLTEETKKQMWFYAPKGTYKASWQPKICSGCYPTVVHPGSTYTISGTQFNGFSQGAMYGDDAQSATNYPLVLITNTQTGHKFFARTHGFSTMAVATGGQTVSTEFDVSTATETGYSFLVVIANGIPSPAVEIDVES